MVHGPTQLLTFKPSDKDCVLCVGCVCAGVLQCLSLHWATESLSASKICSSCQVAHYCSSTCSAAHWKQHKHICRRLQGEGAAEGGGKGSSSSSKAATSSSRSGDKGRSSSRQ